MVRTSKQLCGCISICVVSLGTYTSACDVWSFGILMWEVFAFGIIPYQGLTNTQAMERVDDGQLITESHCHRLQCE